MTRFRAWGLSATMAVGTVVPAVAADPPRQTTLADKLFGPSKPKAKPAAPMGRPSTDALSTSTPALPSLSPEIVLDALRAEQDAYLRRLTVCGELRRVGGETQNDALIRQADELERQAAALYNQRVAALGVPRVKAPLPDPTPSEVVDADSPFDARSAANRLTAPAAPTPVTGSAEVKVPVSSPAPNTGGNP